MAVQRKPRVDQELEEYRTLMGVPETFEEGFGVKAIIGAIFTGFIMMPGSIYLGLVAGQSMGEAAQWVTIILFADIARRSFTTLKKQELYILFYVAGSLVSFQAGLALAGGPFAGLIWHQYLVQSPAFKGLGLAEQIPNWVSPQPTSEAILRRTFVHRDWLAPIGLLLLGNVLWRLTYFTLGYGFFRLCSDFERLPFPMAPIAAQGATALAETTTHEETWRWRVFSIGAMIGLVFGVFYVGIPSLTGAVMAKPLMLIPIPWVDLTKNTESLLPAAATGFTTNLGTILVGSVVPFWAVVGGFIAAIGTTILNPILYKMGVLHTWRPGMDTINTIFVNHVDFWMSVGIGVSVAVGVIGICSITKAAIIARREMGDQLTPRRTIPKGRGDIPMPLALMLGIFCLVCYIILCAKLAPGFPLYFLIFFAFIFTPLNSYINARMTGLTGQYAGIPMVVEGTIILSHYKKLDIWFAPKPVFDFGGAAQSFRVVELTGTKITSIMKTEAFVLPLMLFCSFIFWSFIWKLAPIPSQAYPYAQKMWNLSALQTGLWYTATMKGKSLFAQAVKVKYIVGGLAFALIGYAILSVLGLPILLVYGIIRGMGNIPHNVLPEIVGALLGRYYFMKRFGTQQWRLYATVLLAGFSCGTGLVGMGCVAMAMISKSVSQLPF